MAQSLTPQNRQRVRVAPLTPIRALRLTHGLTIAEVSHESGLTTFRLSIIERDPEQARPEEIEAHRQAVEAIAQRMRGAA